jgi:ribose/xylose/arabinose/galactoside ABC-type transport system permease subunit
MTATPLSAKSSSAPSSSAALRTLRGFFTSQEGILLIVIVLLMVVVGANYERFRATNNLLNIFESNAYIAVAAVGMSLVIISGNIDISIGSLVGVLSILSGTIVTSPELTAALPLWMVVALAWILPIIVGALVGAVNGFFVAYLRIPAIVVTLGMASILQGGLIIVLGGTTIYNMPPEFFLAQQDWLGLPSTVWFMIIATIGGALWMRYSATGRSIYAVGGNAEAARLSGINSQRVIFNVFVINGIMVGISSVMFATQFTSIQASVPVGLELQVITAAVVGGVSILGGTGTVIGATLATILISTIRSSMIFIGVSPYWLRAVQGALILVTVLADMVRRRGLPPSWQRVLQRGLNQFRRQG